METTQKPQITMIPTSDSSIMKEYGYDKDNSSLIVNYIKTGYYCYQNISQEDFDSIALAESPGKEIRKVCMSKIYVKTDESKFVRAHG